MKIFVIGSGNIAYHMVRAIWKSDHILEGLYSRNESEARSCTRGEKVDLYHDISKITTTSDIYLICVSDDAIASIVTNLPIEIRKKKIVAHTSGSQALEILGDINHQGVFYPVQTFTKGRKMAYNDIPFCINANDDNTEDALIELANSISSNTTVMSDADRQIVHVSAVMINNFVNHLIYKSESNLEANDIPVDLLQPLLKQTILKQSKLGSYDSQTGPAMRNDESTIETHLSLLSEQSDKDIYQAITNSIIETYK